MARIVVNTRFLLSGKMEGFGWYTYEISKRLVEKHPEHEFIFFFDRPFDEKFIFGKNVTPVVLNPPARHPILHYIWFEWSVRRALKKYNADLFFSPDGYLSLSSKVPQIGVIHDINFEHFPKDLPFCSRKYLRYFFPKYAKKATKLITVSDYSKNDICSTYGVDSRKIVAIWNGASEVFNPISFDQRKETQVKYSGGNPYFLFVGSLNPRKNVRRLLEAYQKYRTKIVNPFEMVIVGEAMWSKREYRNLRNEHVHFTGHIDLSSLAQITASAEVLTYVPYFEGFGIPLVEAMRCGVPILSGNLTSLPEVAGEAALYCNPLDTNDICEKMVALTNNVSLRENLSKLGIERSALFSWDKSANEVWKEIEGLL